MQACVLSHFQLCADFLTVHYQVLLSLRFPREAYQNGFSFPSPGNLPGSGSNLHLLHWQKDSLPLSYFEVPPKSRNQLSVPLMHIQHTFSERLEKANETNDKQMLYLCISDNKCILQISSRKLTSLAEVRLNRDLGSGN